MSPDHPDPSTIAALDRAHVWHPFTPMREWRAADPLIIASGEGDYLIDVLGRRFIDGVSSLWCNVHGHRVHEIDEAVRDQLGQIAHTTLLGLASVPSARLAGRLVRVAPTQPGCPPLNRVFFSDSGATATELAFKMAVGYHYHSGRPDRSTILAFSGAYHGDTVGAMSVGYSDAFHRPFHPLTFRTLHAPAPDIAHSPEAAEFLSSCTAAQRWPSRDSSLASAVRDRCLVDLDRLLDENQSTLAAICVEPLVQGAAGIVTHPDGFLSAVAARARALSIPLIADEVATGFGRTALMFACNHENVVPDILCLAKGISAGYLPLAATLATDDIEAAFQGEPWEHRTLYHGHTYTGNPLACAAGLASLDLFEKNRVLENARRNADRIALRLTHLSDHPNVFDVRQRGLMVGIELCAARPPRGKLTHFDPRRRIGHEVCAACRPHGLIIRPLGNTLVLMPMPAMRPETLDRMLDIVIDVISHFPFSRDR